MDFNSNDFRDQLEAILFKIRTGFIQVSKLLVYELSAAHLSVWSPASSRLASTMPQL